MNKDFTERIYFVAHDAEENGTKVIAKRLSRDYFEAANAARALERLRAEQPQAYVVERVRFL